MIRIGAQYLGGSLSPKTFAVAVEEAGFDSVWCGDHVSHYVDGIATLGCYAGATETIEIGTNVLVAPLRPAVVAAKALATVADIAGPQRLVAGIGVGGDFPAEIAAVGAEMRQRGAYTDEALELIRLLWSGEPISYDGRWTQLADYRIEPAPDPAPRVWIGGRADAALRRAVRSGSGYLGYLLSPSGVAKRAARIAELALEQGRAPADLTIACNVFFVPARTVDEAVDAAIANGMSLQGLTPELVRSFFLLGDDEACLARIQQYVDAGLDHLILGCAPGGEDELRTFLAAATRLLPEIRALVPAAATTTTEGVGT
ncbi:MAG: putative F420-dependent dehydrogenase [Conexibacter sp.]|nr:putative F420-dependent dehydrogenase [Conexibacter sp.]